MDFAHPELSLIWKYFGTQGNYSTGYCVKDGMFTELELVKCMRRQWNADNTISSWYSPEHQTILMHNDSIVKNGIHFLPHLSIGGWNGDHSINIAPNE